MAHQFTMKRSSLTVRWRSSYDLILTLSNLVFCTLNFTLPRLTLLYAGTSGSGLIGFRKDLNPVQDKRKARKLKDPCQGGHS